MSLESPPAHWAEKRSNPKISIFLLIVALITCGAVLHSAVGTRLDGFTLDEPYHIVAGVSYVQRGDFRINPEHPPLVKLWVAVSSPPSVFISPLFVRFTTSTTSGPTPTTPSG